MTRDEVLELAGKAYDELLKEGEDPTLIVMGLANENEFFTGVTGELDLCASSELLDELRLRIEGNYLLNLGKGD